MTIGMMAIVFTNNLFYLITAILLGFVAISGLLAEMTLTRLGASRHLPQEVFATTPTLIEVEVRNGKIRAPTLGLFVREGSDGPFGVDRAYGAHMPAQGSTLFRYVLRFPRRGIQHFGGLWVSTVFPFGLWEKAVFLDCPGEVLVFPCPTQPRIDLRRAIMDRGRTELSVRGHGDGLVSIRDYVAGDPSRLIHWRSSARSGSLKVKELERQAHRGLDLILSPMMPEHLEAGLSLATGLLLEAEAASVCFSLMTHSMSLEPGQGRIDLHRALRHLATYENAASFDWRPPMADHPRPGIATVIIHEAGLPPPWIGECAAVPIPVDSNTGENHLPIDTSLRPESGHPRPRDERTLDERTLDEWTLAS